MSSSDAEQEAREDKSTVTSGDQRCILRTLTVIDEAGKPRFIGQHHVRTETDEAD